jgi:hypothetical protein
LCAQSLSTLSQNKDPFKDYEVDPKDLQFLEELAGRTEHLWAGLSSTIATIEAELAKSQPAALENASRVLPPTASQVRFPLSPRLSAQLRSLFVLLPLAPICVVDLRCDFFALGFFNDRLFSMDNSAHGCCKC